MTGLRKDNVLAGIRESLESAAERDSREAQSFPQGYEVADCSARVVMYMLSTITRHHDWAGIRRLD